MFEWAATFIKLTGKTSWWVCMEFAGAYGCEPTTVLGCVVLGTSTLAGTYFFGPGFVKAIATLIGS